MKYINFKDLILNIIKALSDENIGFGRTRLIKIAYLTELEFYRKHQERLTDADWIYYKFGPYPINYNDYLEHNSIQKDDDNYNFTKIQLDEFANVPNLQKEISLLIKKVIKKHGTLSLNYLLDYVYYDTEPMMNVESRGEALDFNTVLSQDYYKIIEFKNTYKIKKKLQQKYKDKIQHGKRI